MAPATQNSASHNLKLTTVVVFVGLVALTVLYAVHGPVGAVVAAPEAISFQSAKLALSKAEHGQAPVAAVVAVAAVGGPGPEDTLQLVVPTVVPPRKLVTAQPAPTVAEPAAQMWTPDGTTVLSETPLRHKMPDQSTFDADFAQWRKRIDRALDCRVDEVQWARYKSLKGAPRHDHGGNGRNPDIYVALNLKQNAEIVGNLVFQLVEVIKFLGKARVYVAVYESDSNDGTTETLLELGRLLRELGVSHWIAHGNLNLNSWDHRIDFLAKVRNAALIPLRHYHAAFQHKFDRIIFMNDIVVCASDVLELLLQAHLQNADMTCGSDFDTDPNRNPTEPGFYDTWVARDIRGEGVTKFPPDNFDPGHPETNARIKDGLPFYASCCWNGMVVLAAAPFYHTLPTTNAQFEFRREHSKEFSHDDPRAVALRGSFQGRLYEGCSASEMNVLCKDLYRMGHPRFVWVPTVRVAYNFREYTYVKQYFPHKRHFNPAEDHPLGPLTPPAGMFCLPMDGSGIRGPDGYDRTGFVAVPVGERVV